MDTESCVSNGSMRKRGILALVDLHICDRLPFIHSYEPGVVLLPAAEINDKLLLFTTQSSQHGIEALLREFPRGK
jgi:hypothetical protein